LVNRTFREPDATAAATAAALRAATSAGPEPGKKASATPVATVTAPPGPGAAAGVGANRFTSYSCPPVPSSSGVGSAGPGTSAAATTAGPRTTVSLPVSVNATQSATGPVVAGAVRNDGAALWTDKYKPRRASDLVGNNAALNLLTGWLRDWEAVHIHGASSIHVAGWENKDFVFLILICVDV
jgi:hypothetical protein